MANHLQLGSLGNCKAPKGVNRYKHTSTDKRYGFKNLLLVGRGSCGGRGRLRGAEQILEEIPFYGS